MRRAMICVSVMLALLQIWPMVFSQRGVAAATTGTAAETPKPVPAVATARVIAVSVKASVVPKGCYKQYEAAFSACAKSDQACHIKTADQWDLCEATGLWPS